MDYKKIRKYIKIQEKQLDPKGYGRVISCNLAKKENKLLEQKAL